MTLKRALGVTVPTLQFPRLSTEFNFSSDICLCVGSWSTLCTFSEIVLFFLTEDMNEFGQLRSTFNSFHKHRVQGCPFNSI